MVHALDTWATFTAAQQDRIAGAAYSYLKQALPFTPSLTEYQQWRRGLSPGWQAIQPDEKLTETWDSLPVIVDFIAAESVPADWLRGALPNMFNMTFSLHQFMLKQRDFSIHEFMLEHLSGDDYLAWLGVQWPTSLL